MAGSNLVVLIKAEFSLNQRFPYEISQRFDSAEFASPYFSLIAFLVIFSPRS